ncbi:UNVERIFIED_CONTAM: hypothetical protein FKN15_059502 [Acipenser sinensis]
MSQFMEVMMGQQSLLMTLANRVPRATDDLVGPVANQPTVPLQPLPAQKVQYVIDREPVKHSYRRGRQPIDIRLSVMAVTRRGLPIENITGAEALVESCGDGEPQKKKRATEQSISSSRGETLGSPVYER